MPIDTFLTLLTLAMVSAWTPGPNNAILAASGVNFGIRASLPLVMGIIIGFPLMVFIVALFLGEAFQQSLLLREILRYGGAALLLWVAWKIATADRVAKAEGAARPFSFLQAAAFQWINPKGWVMAVALSAQFVRPDAPYLTAGIVTFAFVLSAITSGFGWLYAGHAMRRWLASPARLRGFNYVMGGTIALGVVYLLIS